MNQHPLETTGVDCAKGKSFPEGNIRLKNPSARHRTDVPFPFVGQPILEILSGMDALRYLRKGELALKTFFFRLHVVVHHPEPVAIEFEGFFDPFMESPRSPLIDRKPEINKSHLSFPKGFPSNLPNGLCVRRRDLRKDLLGVKRFGRTIGGGVVDQDKTIDRSGLAKKAIQAFHQKIFAVIGHKNDKNLFRVSSHTISFQCPLSDPVSIKFLLWVDLAGREIVKKEKVLPAGWDSLSCTSGGKEISTLKSSPYLHRKIEQYGCHGLNSPGAKFFVAGRFIWIRNDWRFFCIDILCIDECDDCMSGIRLSFPTVSLEGVP